MSRNEILFIDLKWEEIITRKYFIFLSLSLGLSGFQLGECQTLINIITTPLIYNSACDARFLISL